MPVSSAPDVRDNSFPKASPYLQDSDSYLAVVVDPDEQTLAQAQLPLLLKANAVVGEQMRYNELDEVHEEHRTETDTTARKSQAQPHGPS